MKRATLVSIAILLAIGLAAWADCGCTTDTAEPCYTTFKSNEIIEFSLVVPVDYYWTHDTTATPLITAWWVETEDGLIVKHAEFSEPRGHWETFTWDLTDDDGKYVEAGDYRIVVATTVEDAVGVNIRIVPSCCSPCFACCPPIPCSCRPLYSCSVPFGELYLNLESAGTRSCCGCTLQLYFGSP